MNRTDQIKELLDRQEGLLAEAQGKLAGVDRALSALPVDRDTEELDLLLKRDALKLDVAGLSLQCENLGAAHAAAKAAEKAVIEARLKQLQEG